MVSDMGKIIKKCSLFILHPKHPLIYEWSNIDIYAASGQEKVQ